MTVYSAVSMAVGDMSDMYDNATLQYWSTRYQRSSNEILAKVILPYLFPEERHAVARLELQFPPSDSDLMNFHASLASQTVFLPTSSMKFLDDLCVAYAWLWANNYNLNIIEEYIAALKYKSPGDFPGGRYPTPLQALKVPANALDDPKVDRLSLRFFNSARAFILAHELAHIRFGHHGSTVANEEAADAFALKVLSQTGTVPMGAVLYFQALALWVTNPVDSDYSETHANHPLNSKRLRTLAETLERMAGDFSKNEQNEVEGIATVRFISNGIQKIAEYLDDTECQRKVAKYASTFDLASLVPQTIHARLPIECY